MHACQTRRVLLGALWSPIQSTQCSLSQAAPGPGQRAAERYVSPSRQTCIVRLPAGWRWCCLRACTATPSSCLRMRRTRRCRWTRAWRWRTRRPKVCVCACACGHAGVVGQAAVQASCRIVSYRTRAVSFQETKACQPACSPDQAGPCRTARCMQGEGSVVGNHPQSSRRYAYTRSRWNVSHDGYVGPWAWLRFAAWLQAARRWCSAWRPKGSCITLASRPTKVATGPSTTRSEWRLPSLSLYLCPCGLLNLHAADRQVGS